MHINQAQNGSMGISPSRVRITSSNIKYCIIERAKELGAVATWTRNAWNEWGKMCQPSTSTSLQWRGEREREDFFFFLWKQTFRVRGKTEFGRVALPFSSPRRLSGRRIRKRTTGHVFIGCYPISFYTTKERKRARRFVIIHSPLIDWRPYKRGERKGADEKGASQEKSK